MALWPVCFLLFALWSFATPIWGYPDEQSHSFMAYSVGHGDLWPERVNVLVGTGNASGITHVPQSYLDSVQGAACYIFHPDVSAACYSAPSNDPSEIVPWANPAGRYFPAYYFVVGLVSNGAPIQHAVLAMRLVAALIAALMLAWAVAAAMMTRRPGAALIGIAVAATPMAIYLGGAANPNSLEIFAMLALAASAMAYLQHSGTPLGHVLMRRALIAAAILGPLRLLSPIWIAYLFAAFLILARGEQIRELFKRPLLGWFGLAFAANVISIVWIPVSGSTDFHDKPQFTYTLAERWDLSREFIDAHMWRQAIGNFNWGDTPLPDFSFQLWVIAALVAMGLALGYLNTRPALTAIGLAIGAYVLSVGLHAAQWNQNGPVWQGRYSLPLLMLVPVVAFFSYAADRDPLRGARAPAARWVLSGVAVIIGYVHVSAMYTDLRRNVSGLTEGSSAFDGPWKPSLPAWFILGAYTALIVALVAVIIAMLLASPGWRERTVYRIRGRRSDRAGVTEEPADSADSDGALSTDQPSGVRAVPVATVVDTPRKPLPEDQ